MNSSILTSDRYIAVISAGSLVLDKTVRVLTNVAGQTLCIPARWSEETKRLEAVSINASAVPAMYRKDAGIEAKLRKAGVSFQWLTLDEARSLTS